MICRILKDLGLTPEICKIHLYPFYWIFRNKIKLQTLIEPDINHMRNMLYFYWIFRNKISFQTLTESENTKYHEK